MSIQPGLGYNITSTPDGTTLDILNVDSLQSLPIQSSNYEQFQILVSGNQLRVITGTVLWASHNFGGEGGLLPHCTNQTVIANYTRYAGDSVVVGTEDSRVMSQNGYVTLNT